MVPEPLRYAVRPAPELRPMPPDGGMSAHLVAGPRLGESGLYRRQERGQEVLFAELAAGAGARAYGVRRPLTRWGAACKYWRTQ
jgi:hypothetical protein